MEISFYDEVKNEMMDGVLRMFELSNVMSSIYTYILYVNTIYIYIIANL